MSDVDKWLEEIANHDGTTLRMPSVRDLTAALLRARKALAVYAMQSTGPGDSRAHAALADPELEKLLR